VKELHELEGIAQDVTRQAEDIIKSSQSFSFERFAVELLKKDSDCQVAITEWEEGSIPV
jgi:hypothetical protein